MFTARVFAGQGAQRMLYSVPNSPFIENPNGDSNVVTINDSSGSIATLQSLINSARATNENAMIVIHLLSGATYSVSSSSIVLGSQECLVGTGALVQAANSSATVPLVEISDGATNVSIAGGTYDGNGANTYCIYAPSSSARINIDDVTARNCGQDCIQLNGTGDTNFDNEMTVTRCNTYGSALHAGISIWNATQAACVENYCHNCLVGVWLGNCSYCTVANNTCVSNTTGIDFNSGSDDYICNNTCNNNGTGITATGSGAMIVSDLFYSNTVAGINSAGSGNIYCDNLFEPANATNFINNGSGDKVVAYKGTLNAAGQKYFYPPLISDQHTNTIVNGMGRTDLTIASTTIDSVQSQYNTAHASNPTNVIVLHLNGTFTVGSNALILSSNTCVLLNGLIQINSSTTATATIAGTNSPSNVCISGGTIDGGNFTANNAITFSNATMVQVDAVTLQNFGPANPRTTDSDVVRFQEGGTPRIVTRCLVNGGSARGIWLENSSARNIVSDNESTGVNMDGVDCDASTSASLIKFNYCHDNVRYGIFVEQSASYNCLLGNICNYDQSHGIGCYNNSTTPRGSTEYNSIICNSLLGDNGLRNGSTGTNVVTTSHNFFFNNTVVNANIVSQLYGTQNYYSQNYLSGSSISTSGAEVFFNPPDVSGNVFVQDNHSGLDAIVQNAAKTNGAPVITGTATGLGNDLWQLLPTDSGYYQVKNKNSGLALVVQNASTNSGAPIIQWTYDATGNDEWMPKPAGNGLYSFVNRLSGLTLDVTDRNTTPGTPLDQQPSVSGASQQFELIDAAPQNGAVIMRPQFTSIQISGSNLILNGTNSTAGSQYVLLKSTNLAQPSSQWTPVLTNTFSASTFSITTAFNQSAAPNFYILQIR